MSVSARVKWVSVFGVAMASACADAADSSHEPKSGSKSKIGTWAEPVLLNSEHAADPSAPELDMNDAGRALVLWSETTGTEARLWSVRYTPADGWALAELLRVAPLIGEYRVAVDENGDGIAIWSEAANSAATLWSVWASRFRADAGWGAPEPLDEPDVEASLGRLNSYNMALSMNPQGEAFAAWTDPDNKGIVRARPFDSEAGWGSAETISSEVMAWSGAGIALCEDGSAVAMWGTAVVGQVSLTSTKMWTNRYEPGVGWGNAVSSEAMVQNAPQLACGSDGSVAGVWDFTAHPYMGTAVARYDRSGEWKWSLQHLHTAGSRMALDGAGNAMVVLAPNHEDNGPVEVFVDQPSVGSGEPQPIESGTVDGSVLGVDVASNHAGQTLAIWSRATSPGDALWIRAYEPGVGWSDTEGLVSGNPTCPAPCSPQIQPKIAMDANGNAIAVWPATNPDNHGDVWAQVLTRVR